MNEAVITYTDEDTGTVFQWHGGAYIEVGGMRSTIVGSGLYESYGPEVFEAQDVINVWDYALDRSVYEVNAERGTGEGYLPGTRPFRRILEMFEYDCQQYL